MLERTKSKLDLLNEQLAPKGLHMHPTKGVRKLGYRRMMASIITEEMKRGNRNWSMKAIQAAMRASAYGR